MDSQQTANSVVEPASSHGETMVKPNAPLPQQGFQARPQGPPLSPRNSINNGPIGVPRPGPPLRRLDSRSSLGPPPASGQFVQLRPYGPPRPPGGSFPPRSPQPGQLPPQNPLLPPNQRFVYSPGIRGPPPQGIGGQRPPFVVNQQAYQAQQQQQQRGGNDPRFQRPDVAPSQNEPRRPSQESIFPRQLLRNDSSVSLQRQHLLSNEEIKQPTRPRIVIEKMADINETADKPEDYLQGKKSDVRENGENDDDDDVVMDNNKSPRHNGDGTSEELMNGSKSPSTPRKLDDVSRPASRPGTATIGNKVEQMDDKQDISSRPISANIANTTTLISQSRPSSAINNDKEEKKEELADRSPSKEINAASEEIKKSSSPYNNDAQNVEQGLKTPSKSSDNSRSVTPSYLDTPQNAEQNRSPDKSRSSTPARLEPSGNAEQEPKTPVKTPDKSRSSTPAGLESSGNAELESRTPESKTLDKSRASTPASQLASSPNAERDLETAARTPNKSRSSTPQVGVDSINIEADKPSENPHRDKSAEGTLRVKESSRPASSLSLTSEKGSKLKSPRSPTPGNRDKLSGWVSPEDIKGYDNGQPRTLSSSRSPRLPKSPVDSGKQTEDEKKKTFFVEDSVTDEKANKTSAAMSKPTTLTVKTPTSEKSDDEKAEKKAAEKKAVQNGRARESVSGAQSTNEDDKRSNAGSPTKSVKSLPKTPDTPTSTAQDKKKVPMNKVQVGAAPSPNLKTVRSKIGSLDNASYKPGGGKVKIENRKLDFSKAQPKIAAKNEKYAPSGGDKKISQVKLQWNAKSKVGSLENATYKPGGGDKKIETVKLDFKDKAKPKVGSKDNAKHIPGGGTVKIPTQKLDIKAESKIGSLDNVKHKPGGGDKKIFNDRDYLRQTSSNVESLNGSGSQSPVPSGAITGKNGLPASDENLNQEC
ncbi:PREDICTED: microtubule-associated protein tau isoform X2 [Trachymyrmex cornetzi]|uniref:microtubule-associated protein tau isoform X2 n=1 Tax=Trachymyrmex cornetzi TaxID=471704 RepID=UPI00084EEA17|nr:PREDICTED: microtubule-associated protein tau isoform X2 [Trachymyrmex cornetzi]